MKRVSFLLSTVFGCPLLSPQSVVEERSVQTVAASWDGNAVWVVDDKSKLGQVKSKKWVAEKAPARVKANSLVVDKNGQPAYI